MATRSIIHELDVSLGSILGTLQAGLRDYAETMEKNLREVVNISNPLISEATEPLQTQIRELQGQLEELTSVISESMEKVNARTRSHRSSE
jgi:TolA-binding protein